jgi:hypothetical protein
MKIISDVRAETGWITAIIDGRWCQAKVYDDPSSYGIRNGRVSKLAVSKTSQKNEMGQPFFDAMAFNYDRGLDFNNLPKGVLDSIVAQLESLPKVFETQTSSEEPQSGDTSK